MILTIRFFGGNGFSLIMRRSKKKDKIPFLLIFPFFHTFAFFGSIGFNQKITDRNDKSTPV